jgi:hypothetical protein
MLLQSTGVAGYLIGRVGEVVNLCDDGVAFVLEVDCTNTEKQKVIQSYTLSPPTLRQKCKQMRWQ